MASRVGHLSRVGSAKMRDRISEATSVEELKAAMLDFLDTMDGRVRARNDSTGEEWAGRVVVMGGGMLCFDTVDERGSEVDAEEYYPESVVAAAEERVAARGANSERVKVQK